MGDDPSNRVRERREARGFSQILLAERARLTRQSVGAIEAGRAVPSVEVALRLARALDCHVEEFFGAAAEEDWADTEPVSPAPVGRVAMAEIAGRGVSHPLGADGLRVSADGVVVQSTRTVARVAPMRPLAETREVAEIPAA